MSAVISRTIEFLLLPPGNLVLLVVLALVFYRSKAWLIGILVFACLQTAVLSLPVVADKLLVSLERQYPPTAKLWQHGPLPQAIVVLGAGRNQQAEEYGGSMSGSSEMERLNYAAYLHRHTGLPILVSGGASRAGMKSEAEFMQEVLEEVFKVPVQWLETQSHTTWENAQYSDKILHAAGIESAWVVTQAWHMPRALHAFQNKQLHYYPASTSYGSSGFWRHEWMWWIPQSTALTRSSIALHEWVGLFSYRLRR